MRELLELLSAAGHDGFRDARGPLGFNQRQASGKFSRDEAQAFIDQLEEVEHVQELASLPPRRSAQPISVPSPTAVRLTPAERAMRNVTDEELLIELRRRGLMFEH